MILTCIFFQYFKDVALLCISDKKPAVIFFFIPLYVMYLDSMDAFIVSCLLLVSTVWLWCAFVWAFFMILFFELPGSVNVQLSNPENSQSLFSWPVFLAHPSLIFFRDSNYTYIRLFEIVLQLADVFFHLKKIPLSPCISFWIVAICLQVLVSFLLQCLICH